MKKKVLFLYTELADYFLACCNSLLNSNVDVHIVRYPTNKEAPFKFEASDKINFYNRIDYTSEALVELVDNIKPDIIVCSGWTDKSYLTVTKKYFKKATTILALDNHWNGSVKQQIARVISRFFLLNKFSKCWVTGERQKDYAIKLGFEKKNILTGFYSCNFDFFYNQYIVNLNQKIDNLPKRFIFVGRYYEFKGIKDLWSAFIKLQKEYPNDWELWCLGTGNIEPVQHDKIKHFGFVQPKDLSEYIKNTSVFVLPSHFEPWGVVVHEFAAAGFPIICSDMVGAAEAFVENNENGFIFKSGNIEDLKSKLLRIINLSNLELNKMGEYSVEKSKTITPVKWAEKIIKI